MTHNAETHRLIRQYVDGELAPADVARMERRLESDASLRARVEFEHRLRERTASAMSSTTAPTGLIDRVREAIAGADAPLGAIGPDGPRMSWFAVAASIALVAGAVLLGIFGPRITQPPAPQNATGQVNLVDEIAQWSSSEHTRYAMALSSASGTPEEMAALLPVRSLKDAARAIGEAIKLDGVVNFPDLSCQGFEFLGCSSCENTSCGSTVARVMYTRPKTHVDGPAMLSFFVMKNDDGRFNTAEVGSCTGGSWSPVASNSCRHKVLLTRDDKVAIFMVCCDPGATRGLCDTLKTPLTKGICSQR